MRAQSRKDRHSPDDRGLEGKVVVVTEILAKLVALFGEEGDSLSKKWIDLYAACTQREAVRSSMFFPPVHNIAEAIQDSEESGNPTTVNIDRKDFDIVFRDSNIYQRLETAAKEYFKHDDTVTAEKLRDFSKRLKTLKQAPKDWYTLPPASRAANIPRHDLS